MTAPFEIEEVEAGEVSSDFARSRVQGDPPLVCFPMRIEWEMAGGERSQRAEHPEPEMVGVWGGEVDVVMPAAVLKLSEQAREAGWEVRVCYARGTLAKTLVHSLAVSFQQHPLGVGSAVAVYAKSVRGAGSWSWRSVWLWGPDIPHFGACGVTELREWLEVGGQVEPGWYRRVAASVAAREEARKAREACNRGAHPAGEVEQAGGEAVCGACGNTWPAAGRPWRREVKAKEVGG